MELVLADLTKWLAQLKTELAQIEENLAGFDDAVKAQKEHLENQASLATQKISETEEILAKLGHEVPAEVIEAEEVETVEAPTSKKEASK